MNDKRQWPCVCVDLETLGTGPDAAILEIGAVCFDPVTGELGPSFSSEVSGYGQEKRRIDFDTLSWWMAREKEGLDMPGKKGVVVGLGNVLVKLEEFFRENEMGQAEVWAWGSDFDFPILKHALVSYGFDLPWHYSKQRDARTFCDALGAKRGGDVMHRALADAGQEAIAVMEAMGRVKVLEQLGVEVEVHADEEEFRWAVLEEEPDFKEGWNAYRRELLETVGMTMLPTWEKLPGQVQESWCVGVRAALKTRD